MPDTRPTAAQAASKTLNRLRSRGLKEVAGLAWERMKGWVSSGDTLVMFVRDAAPEAPHVPDLTFREATASDAVGYARDIGTDSESSFRSRLSESTHCFLVLEDDLLLHASWVTTTGAWTRELRTYLVPPPGDAYTYESFTRSEARGRGIYPFALHHVVAWAAGAEIARVWVAVEEHNEPSKRSVAKAGFAEAFRVGFARKLGRLRVAPPSGPDTRHAATFMSRKPPI